MRRGGKGRAAWLAVFVLPLVPLTVLLVAAGLGRLGANPPEKLILETGEWTLRLLLLTLAASPVFALTGWNGLLRYRRMFGLYAFFYAVLHFLSYAYLDQLLRWREILADVLERPFIAAGMVGLLLMAPLALTSTAGWIRRLGPQRWQRLHQLVYLAAAAGVLHFWWKVKADTREPLVYVAILGVLLLLRLPGRARLRRWRQRLHRVRPAALGADG